MKAFTFKNKRLNTTATLRPDTGYLYEVIKTVLLQDGYNNERARKEAELVASLCGSMRTGWYDCPQYSIVIKVINQ